MFRLSIIFLLIHDIRFYKHELSDNVKSWFGELLKNWQAQDATLKSAVEQVLDMVAKDAENVLPGFPASEEELIRDFKKICKKDDLLLYEHKFLKEKISALSFSLQTEDILNRLDEKGIIRRNKRDLNYSLKIGGTTVRSYAFYLDKLKIDNRK